jgi:hypothetical protein
MVLLPIKSDISFIVSCASCVNTILKAVVDINVLYIQKSTSTSDFNIKELRSSKLTIYLSSNMKDSERVQPITRLFIELAAVELCLATGWRFSAVFSRFTGFLHH